jgi:hypothetical protein
LAVLDDLNDIECLFADIEHRGDLQAGLDLAEAALKRRPSPRVLYTSCHAVTDGESQLATEARRMPRGSGAVTGLYDGTGSSKQNVSSGASAPFPA